MAYFQNASLKLCVLEELLGKEKTREKKKKTQKKRKEKGRCCYTSSERLANWEQQVIGVKWVRDGDVFCVVPERERGGGVDEQTDRQRDRDRVRETETEEQRQTDIQTETDRQT